MIDTKKLYDLHINEVKIQRSAARGFMPFICSLIDDIQRVSLISSYVELGVAGAGSHKRYAEASTDVAIYGIERFHPSMTDIATYSREIESYNNAVKIMEEFPNIEVLFGESAYDHTAPEKLSKLSNKTHYDLINDDAATDWPRMRHSLDVWKNSVADHGAFITEVPDGMGVESWWNRTREEHIANYDELAKDGLVVFDLECDKLIPPGYEKDYDAHFFGLWMPNWDVATNTIEKYRSQIVSGVANIKYHE
jgi:hypothetical protein